LLYYSVTVKSTTVCLFYKSELQVQIVTEKFAVDLGIRLRWRKPTVFFL